MTGTGELMETLIRVKQREIIAAIEAIEDKKFRIDEYQRPGNTGYGITSVIEGGKVIERGGVNISVVTGILPEAAIKRMKVDHESLRLTEAKEVAYSVWGLSLILHPVNPFAPTIHLNYRYFETRNEDGTPQAWWFGGGTDLTPSYLIDEDAKFFHNSLKKICDSFDASYYPKYKKWCDEYFRNSHRNESRGIGGIFFDDVSGESSAKLYEFAAACLGDFLPVYLTILNRRKDTPYTEENKLWQQIRRGRYVEFNLLHDRGTAFGMQAPNARVESILVSMPLTASWRYDHHPEAGSEEARLLEVLTTPIEWAD